MNLNTTTNFERNTALQEEKHLQILRAYKLKVKVLKVKYLATLTLARRGMTVEKNSILKVTIMLLLTLTIL